MNSRRRKFRASAFALFTLLAFQFRNIASRLRGKSLELPNYTLLEPGLFIGGRCLQPPPNTRVVLNVSPHPDEYSAEEYRWQPLHSGSVPTIYWLREQVEFVDAALRAGKTIFVHCDAGIDRSALIVIAYFMWQKKYNHTEALDFVQRKRSVVNPNPVFRQLLDEWETSLHSVEDRTG